MELKREKAKQGNHRSDKENKSSEPQNKLFIKRDHSYEENIEARGILINKLSEEILFGIFRDKEIASFFMNCVGNSPLLGKMKNVKKE